MLAERNVLVLEEEQLVTGEELFAMGDIGRCELVEGRIVNISPTGGEHGDLENNVAHYLTIFVKPQKMGRVRSGEVGIYTHRNPDTVRAADVLYISNERLANLKSRSFMDVAPELIVEAMSPDDRWTE